MFEEYSNHDKKIYAAYLENDEDILMSASGGIATAMSRTMIDLGGYVAGVSYTNDFLDAEYILTNDKATLEKFRGSKVFGPKLNNIFVEVKNSLDNSNMVLFFGLPCVVASLKKYLKKDYENLITCELVCSGKTNVKVHREFVEKLLSKYKSQITSFSVRAKRNAWLPEYTKVEFANGKCYEFPFKKNEYGQGFKILKESGCIKCPFKGNNRFGDIMIGDYWGATEQDEFWNSNGISVVFAETDKGVKFFESIIGVKKFPTSFEKAVSHNLSVIKSVKPNPEREKVLSTFNSKGLFEAMKHSDTMRHIRLVTKLEKLPFFGQIKKLVHAIKR